MMTKTIQDAYRIVYNDILNKGIEMFVGTYDAKHGDPSFMYGVCAVMEHITKNVSEQDYEDFSTMFVQNMLESEKKARYPHLK